MPLVESVYFVYPAHTWGWEGYFGYISDNQGTSVYYLIRVWFGLVWFVDRNFKISHAFANF